MGGAFLILTDDTARDAAVPGRCYGFAALRRAQALGDVRALAARGRPVIRVHLGGDPRRGIESLRRLVEKALG